MNAAAECIRRPAGGVRLQAREDSKAARRELTDAIQALVEYARAAGSKNAERYYAALSRSANEALAQARPTWRLARDDLSGERLRLLALVERSMAAVLLKGVAWGIEYHAVFELAKHVAYAAAGADPDLIPRNKKPGVRRAQ